MTRSARSQRFTLYLWIGAVFLSLWLLYDHSKFPGTFPPRIPNNIWRTIYVTFVNFFLFEYTYPYLVRLKKALIIKILLGIFFLWAYMMLYSFGLYAWRGLGVALHVWTPMIEFKSSNEALQTQASYSFSSVFFFGIIIHIYDYNKLKRDSRKLRVEKQEAELNFLKSQTNPHFLFNTLNNIYALSRDKSDLAPESILKLSKILRFMLYETSGSFIAIEKEIRIINDYIALERLRYDESLTVDFNHNVEDMKQALPPLLLIPLVENAFKHGVSETRGRPFVDIHLSVNNRQLNFIVKNSNEGLGIDAGVKESIGLSNLRRQLELQFEQYELTVQPGEGIFTAILKINLASHV
jgi:two-component system, LytTR family, sensor kinase